MEYGFFYLINHGIEDTLIWEVFRESKKFFALPPEEKMKLEHNDAHRGYTPIYAETLDPSSEFKGLSPIIYMLLDDDIWFRFCIVIVVIVESRISYGHVIEMK